MTTNAEYESVETGGCSPCVLAAKRCDIPDDVLELAKNHFANMPKEGAAIEYIARQIILAEREAQRERDAKIAESFAQAWDNGKENHENPHYACMDIADAIRRSEV